MNNAGNRQVGEIGGGEDALAVAIALAGCLAELGCCEITLSPKVGAPKALMPRVTNLPRELINASPCELECVLPLGRPAIHVWFAGAIATWSTSDEWAAKELSKVDPQ